MAGEISLLEQWLQCNQKFYFWLNTGYLTLLPNPDERREVAARNTRSRVRPYRGMQGLFPMGLGQKSHLTGNTPGQP